MVLAFGHTGGGHGVCDEDGAVVGFGAEPEFDQFWGDVDAVADEFGVEAVGGEDEAEDAGFAVVEGAHGVEGVGGGGGSGGEDGMGFGGGGVGVSDGDADAARCGVGGELGRAGELGGEGEEADVAFGGFEEAVEGGDAGGEEVGGGVDAALLVRDEGAFQMDADREGHGGLDGGGW